MMQRMKFNWTQQLRRDLLLYRFLDLCVFFAVFVIWYRVNLLQSLAFLINLLLLRLLQNRKMQRPIIMQTNYRPIRFSDWYNTKILTFVILINQTELTLSVSSDFKNNQLTLMDWIFRSDRLSDRTNNKNLIFTTFYYLDLTKQKLFTQNIKIVVF